MLKERQKTILNAVVNQYIDTAIPVASAHIVDNLKLSLSPATVRGELLALDEAGFLEQPHTSAGRIPTDKGYRFYISDFQGDADFLDDREQKMLSDLFETNDDEMFLGELARTVADISRSFAMAGLGGERFCYKAGISEVFQKPEFDDRTLLKEFSELADFIDEEIGRMFGLKNLSEPSVFVGRENPLKEARHCSMFVSAITTPGKKETVLAILGPKRMNYRKNISLFKYLSDF